MTQDRRPELPIGYWLKQVDNLLTEEINKAQATHGVSRSEWQVLNMLKETSGANREQIFETMRTFVDSSSFNDIMTSLVERGWVERRKGATNGVEEFQLTKEGQRRHEAIFATQKQVRQRAMAGISEEEYVTVIRVLRQIVSNLGGKGEKAG
jgi:DNA-binding MarR family transcriptional regulator